MIAGCAQAQQGRQALLDTCVGVVDPIDLADDQLIAEAAALGAQ